MCTPCKEEAKMAIHQIGPESAALAMNMMIQQSPTADDTWIKDNFGRNLNYRLISTPRDIIFCLFNPQNRAPKQSS